MTTSLSFCLARRRRARFLHRFVFACLICVGGRGRSSVHRNYCGGKRRQRAEIWVSSRAPAKARHFGGQRRTWGARGGGRAALEPPGCPCSWLRLLGQGVSRGIALGSPLAAAWGWVQAVCARFCQTPVLPATHALSAARWDGAGGGGWGEEGQPLGEPRHPPRWSRGDFSTKAPAKELLPTCAKPCVPRAAPRAHVSPLGRFSPHRGAGLSGSACFAPVPCPRSQWAGQEGPFCWLQVEAGVGIASRSGWLCSEAAGLRLLGLDLFLHLGFPAPSPNTLLVPEPPRAHPSATLEQNPSHI